MTLRGHEDITNTSPTPRRGCGGAERGGSWSILVLLLVVSFTLGAGLVVDGNRKAGAVRVATAAAGDAARAGVDASATSRLAGRADTGAAVSAARAYLRSVPDVSGSVTVLPGGRLRVTTSQTVPTRYVSLIGIDSLTGRGEAEAELLDTGGG